MLLPPLRLREQRRLGDLDFFFGLGEPGGLLHYIIWLAIVSYYIILYYVILY